MAASAWVPFDVFIRQLGKAGISLSAGGFRASLHKNAASTNLSGAITIFSSIGNELGASGGYAARSLSTNSYTQSGSGVWKFDSTNPVFTASNSDLRSIRFCVIRLSVGATTSGLPVCFCALSTAAFSVAAGNTLTVQMNTAGIFNIS